MNKVSKEHNPLSIDQQVKNKLEKRASGVAVPEPRLNQSSSNRFTTTATPNLSDNTNADLPTQFVNLLFSADSNWESNHNPNNKNEFSREQLNKTGTNPVFFPHKEQEETICSSAEEKGPFSLVIENTQLGALTLNGTWSKGKLKVQLQTLKPLDSQQKTVLTAILQKKLSHELGVQTEIEID